jgi:hypothetical protein
MLLKQVVTRKNLIKEGLTPAKIKAMTISLSLFPTPFEQIYYVPTPEERKSSSLDKPRIVLTRAIASYLDTKGFYYSCRTAEEHWGIKWQPAGEVHVVNEKLSRTINLSERRKRNEAKTTWRAKRIAKILGYYGSKIVFHRAGPSIHEAKFKQTPYGSYALRSQIKKDKKKFREKESE